MLHRSTRKVVLSEAGQNFSIDLPARVRSNSVHLLHDFALADGGITCRPTLVCGEDLRTGALVPPPTKYELLPKLELLAIYATIQRRAVKVRLLVELIPRRFSGELEWDRGLACLFAYSLGSWLVNSVAGSFAGKGISCACTAPTVIDPRPVETSAVS